MFHMKVIYTISVTQSDLSALRTIRTYKLCQEFNNIHKLCFNYLSCSLTVLHAAPDHCPVQVLCAASQLKQGL